MFAGRDWNFAARGDVREHLDPWKHPALSSAFYDTFESRRVAPAEAYISTAAAGAVGHCVLSMIVHLYTNLHTIVLSYVSAASGVRGSVLKPSCSG